MSNTTRGRPTKNTNVLVVNNLKVEYLTTKEDSYNNEFLILKLLILHLELN